MSSEMTATQKALFDVLNECYDLPYDRFEEIFPDLEKLVAPVAPAAGDDLIERAKAHALAALKADIVREKGKVLRRIEEGTSVGGETLLWQAAVVSTYQAVLAMIEVESR